MRTRVFLLEFQMSIHKRNKILVFKKSTNKLILLIITINSNCCSFYSFGSTVPSACSCSKWIWGWRTHLHRELWSRYRGTQGCKQLGYCVIMIHNVYRIIKIKNSILKIILKILSKFDEKLNNWIIICKHDNILTVK